MEDLSDFFSLSEGVPEPEVAAVCIASSSIQTIYPHNHLEHKTAPTPFIQRLHTDRIVIRDSLNRGRGVFGNLLVLFALLSQQDPVFKS